MLYIMLNNMKTYLINLISGPGSGKTTLAALIFAKLKLEGFVCEYVQEFAKTLVWTKDFDTLNNQYYVSKKQADLFEQMVGHVNFIITDGPILNGLYYNRHNKDNTSNIEKTESLIVGSYNKFNNINIFLERGEFKYEQHGRIQTEDESKEIDTILKHMLKGFGIKYRCFLSSPNSVDSIVEHILEIVE